MPGIDPLRRLYLQHFEGLTGGCGSIKVDRLVNLTAD
jgi:hypothetical protein